MKVFNPDERYYSSREICHYARISLRQLQWWCEHKLLRPVIRRHRRYFDQVEFDRARLIAQLREKGLSLHRIYKLRLEVGHLYLCTDGKRTKGLSSLHEVGQWVTEQRQPVYVVSTNLKAMGGVS